MKLILKENPDMELTVTVEYPEQNSQVSRILPRDRHNIICWAASYYPLIPHR